MKKRLKHIFFGIIILATIIIGLAVYFMAPMLLMRPMQTGPVPETDILSIATGKSSVFFIPSGDGYLIIDTGSKSAELKAEMQKQKIDPNAVKHILLTHTDTDHVAGLALFPDANIYISKEEMKMIDRSVKRNAFVYNGFPKDASLERVTILDADLTFACGGRTVKAIKTPGHTLGSMSYIIDGKYLFSGDSIRIKNKRILPHPFSMDKDTARQSANILFKAMKETEFTFTAHYGYFPSKDLTLK